MAVDDTHAGAVLTLTADGVSVVLDATDGRLPAIVHWGAALPPMDAEQATIVALARDESDIADQQQDDAAEIAHGPAESGHPADIRGRGHLPQHGEIRDVRQLERRRVLGGQLLFAGSHMRCERHHLHLSATIDIAKKVGARRGAPLVLEVRAEDMANDGHAFFRSTNGVWLTEHVPPTYLRRHAPDR